MKTYKLGLYEKAMPKDLSMQEKLLATGQSGFEFMEISIDESDEKLNRLKWSAAHRCKILRLMETVGTPIKTMCLSGHRKYPIGSEDCQTRQRGMEIMADAIELADNLGIRIIQIAGYDVYYEPSTPLSKQYFSENLQRSTELAAKSGVTLALETMETDFMNTVSKAMHYIHLIQSPFLQIYPDLGNITNSAFTVCFSSDQNQSRITKRVISDLETGKGHLTAMHLKESLPGRFREVPFGVGHVDFDSAIDYAQTLGVRLFVAEFWHDGKNDWQDQLGFANQFLRSKFHCVTDEVSN